MTKWVVKNSGFYREDGTDQVFDTKKEAERVSRALNSMRGRSWVEEAEEED